MKKSILFILVFTAVAVQAQIKIGTGGTSMVSGNLLQLNGNATATAVSSSEAASAFNSAGSLGIGTTAPTANLDVTSSATTTTFTLRNTSTGGHKFYFNSEGQSSPLTAGSFVLWDGTDDRCRMIISPTTGYVGFGTQTPTTNLDVAGGDAVRTAIAIRNYNGGHHYGLNSEASGSLGAGSFNIYSVTEDKLRLIIKPYTGYVGIGTDANPTSLLDVNGEIEALAIKGPSDKRFKKNIVPLKNSLDKITSLNGYNYEWRRNEFPQKNFKSGTDMGLIAQEVEKVYPEAVYTAEDEMKSKSIDYTKLVPALIESIKELKAEIEELKSQMPYQKR